MRIERSTILCACELDAIAPMGYALRMTTSFLATNIAALRRHLGMNQTQFAEAVEGKQPAVSKWESGADEPSSRSMGKIAQLASCTVDDLIDALWRPGGKMVVPPAPDVQPTRGSADGDGPVSLKRINMGFSMGDGSNLDDIVEEGTMNFDANLLRALTPSPYHRLFVADGNGDSMQPTILDSDLIVIDTLQSTLDKWDRIWAISLQGAGAVKRIGVAEKGKIEIMSDNPIVPNKVVPIEDVRIIGRVVYSGRRH